MELGFARSHTIATWAGARRCGQCAPPCIDSSRNGISQHKNKQSHRSHYFVHRRLKRLKYSSLLVSRVLSTRMLFARRRENVFRGYGGGGRPGWLGRAWAKRGSSPRFRTTGWWERLSGACGIAVGLLVGGLVLEKCQSDSEASVAMKRQLAEFLFVLGLSVGVRSVADSVTARCGSGSVSLSSTNVQ